jgi:hypothetical protein
MQMAIKCADLSHLATQLNVHHDWVSVLQVRCRRAAMLFALLCAPACLQIATLNQHGMFDATLCILT